MQTWRRTLYQQHLQGLVVLEQDVLRGNYFLDVGRLDVGQGVPDPPAFSLVDESKGAGEYGVVTTLAVLGQLVAYQFGDHLGAAGQGALGDHVSQLREQ